MILEIHTDGACSGNQSKENLGGWGAILVYGNHEKEIYGAEVNTTNNKMELTAVIKALEQIKKPNQIIHIFSDSSYLVKAFQDGWLSKWEKNGWVTSSKKPVENIDLWKSLIGFLNNHTISFYKVKGHVNLNSSQLDKEKLLKKFKEWNGDHFTMVDMISAIEMNNRADALANKGVDSLR